MSSTLDATHRQGTAGGTPGEENALRVRLAARYDEVRAHTEALAARLSAEDQTVQSMPDVSPTKWHRAHVTWFFETFLLARLEPAFSAYDERFWFLFNSYYETLGPRFSRPHRGLVSRPGIAEVAAYRANVDARMRAVLASGGAVALEDSADTVELGLHHEQQHQELLLMDIKHVLSINPLRPAYAGTTSADVIPTAMGWVDFDGGLVEVGLDRVAGADPLASFAFDNESPRHRTCARAVPPRRPAGHERRVDGLHRRRRVPALRAVAVRRVGQR